MRSSQTSSRLHLDHCHVPDPDLWTRFRGLIQMPAQAGLNINYGLPVMVLLPLAAAAKIFYWHALVVLVVNIVAIVFLSEAISISSEELEEHLGELQGALLSATFGNTVFGCCLVTASYNKDVLEVNGALAKTLSSLMMITAVALFLPTALYSKFPVSEIDSRVLSFSRGTSLVLLILYAGYLYFYLGTHKHLFTSCEDQVDEGNENVESSTPPTTVSLASLVIRLVTAIVATIFCTELLLESVGDMAETLRIFHSYIALVFVPLASNSTEAVTVISSSRSGNTDSAIIGSLLQIGLFAIPFLVIVGWCIAEPMTLFFDYFETVAMFLAILVVNLLLRDGQYAYIHGAMLIALYCGLVAAFYTR
ncbi:hypothetical protein N7485_001400 [Penicillium canescens]|nr:hypothetical protein N7485_001400 [Penicillium canescens]